MSTNIISKMTVDFSVMFRNLSSFFHFFEIIVEEQRDLYQAKDNVNILQRGLSRRFTVLSYFIYFFHFARF